MGFNNRYFKAAYSGLGLDFYWQQQPFFNEAQADYSLESKLVGNFKSYSNKNFIKYAILSVGRNSEGKDKKNFFVTSNLNKNNDEKLNQTRLVDIIEYLQRWDSTFVDFADFAYLKNLGVYPTNRLMIARRFSAPTQNNLYKTKDKPMATLISWVPDDQDFLSISFGESWTTTDETSFAGIFGDISDDFGNFSLFKKKKGEESYTKGFGLFSLPGITEYIQAKIREKLGLNPADPEYNIFNPPSNNPNLIREGSRRSLPNSKFDADRPFSGLEGKFTIQFSTEYELKFINGVDPSLVYLDIIRNALVFGTSKSVNVLGLDSDNPVNNTLKRLVSGDFEQIQKSLGEIIGAISDSLKKQATDWVKEQRARQSNQAPPPPPVPGTPVPDPTQQILEEGVQFLQNINEYQFSKYRIRLLSIMQLLIGAPTAYWHITIGNPKKPIFSSGDMICGNVTMKFGKVLSYNDLPSSISLEFTLTSARNLGGQEIFDRLNTGQGRTYFNEERAYYDRFFEGGVTASVNGQTQNVPTREEKFITQTEDKLKEKYNPGPGSSN